MSKHRKKIRDSQTKVLITKAGGRCCYRDRAGVCNRLLEVDGVCIGKIAHIIGVNGARSEAKLPYHRSGLVIKELDDELNLLWLCEEHHTLIDSPKTRDNYSIEYLLEMKLAHEQEVRTCRPASLDTDYLDDLSKLVAFFSVVDIRALKERNSDLRYEVSYLLDEFRERCLYYGDFFDSRTQRIWKVFEHYHLSLWPNVLWSNQRPTEEIRRRYIEAVDALDDLIAEIYPTILKLEPPIYNKF
ncbi:hypothetical protein M634_13160 [Vibrio parahaemolyticus O1:Kuk str. FDA_R31]|uniref:hypothetical protein n=1 Tax=Vibrio harveyi group TaxID=717610 RepID=UPI000359083C|nr:MULTISPECIES: hypothetical protein [Vibrio harveyi group]AGQ92432.1 hypothetical protein M634_13160 [Vibrio parahaemolyticus O1:Kuk str. FDA_R31]EJB0393455.1 hypothetical protein [Vibrio parahaemolyticus]EJG2012810.1 hypothetical protein [Vibrio parahaemolyticus]EJG2026550.1 hypothetical protein [Vibrio parahaemolyticus]ODW68697.1 hypothetical protein BBL89_08505 [Vibrio parahaemolyticus]